MEPPGEKAILKYELRIMNSYHPPDTLLNQEGVTVKAELVVTPLLF